MQQLRSGTGFQTGLAANEDSNRGTHSTRRPKTTTYRLREIHESFNCVSLKSALCTHFGVESDGIILRSLAYDAAYSQSSRQKVATVTFKTTPGTLGAGNRWVVKIPLPGEKLQELHDIVFDTTFEGFTPLTPAEQEKNTTIDCILIHGWAGHSIGSFSSPDGDWIWPIDGLCHDIPTLRVWLYGFSSNLQNPISTANVHDYASTFRRALVDSRRLSNSEVVSRPIIYVVHSLGGLILLDTINEMAASQRPDDKITLEMTRGALLFGVPILGMETRALASLTREADLPAAYTASLLDERYGFSQRNKEADKFYATCVKEAALVYAFYETEKTPTVCLDHATQRWVRSGPEELLVKPSSATYGCPERENMISWVSNHNDMLKLKKGDVNYWALLNRLREVQRFEKKQNKWYLADEAIRTYYNSGGRLEIERLSGQKLSIEKCYINLALVDQAKQKQNETKTSSFSLAARLRLEAKGIGEAVAVEDLFEPRKLSNGANIVPRRIFIQGRAGVGKTTLCKKLVHEFLNGQIWQKFFDRLLWIPLRRLKSRGKYSWQDLIQDAHFLKDPKWQQVQKAYSDQFYNPAFLSRTLLLFDGLDEVSQSWSHDAEIYEFLGDIISSSPNVIITSRPQANRFDVGRFDLELETLGFLPDQIDAYLKNCTSEKVAAEMKSFMIERPLIQGLLRIPIQLDAFCTTWRLEDELHVQDQDAISTMTTLYNSILFDLCRKDIIRLWGAQQSRQFSDSEVFIRLKNELRYLGELAFQGMVSNIIEYGPRQQDKIGSFVMKKGAQLPTPYSAVLEGMSFLRASEKEQDPSKANYHFVHLTFQEFFAARHFAEHWQKDTSLVCLSLAQAQRQEELLPFNFLQKEKYNPRYNIFWRFVAGLIQIQSSEPTSSDQHDKHKNLVGFFEELCKEPVDLLEIAHHRLLMCCLSEIVSDGDETRKLQERIAKMLYEETVREYWYSRSIVLGNEAEFPESILCSFLKDEPDIPATEIFSVLRKRPFIRAKTFDVLSEMVSGEFATDLQLGALEVIFRHSHIASEDVLSKAVRVTHLMLEHEKMTVRKSICDVLSGVHPPQEVIATLIKAVEDEDEDSDVRSAAISALGRQQSLPQEAVATLRKALEDENSWVRSAAIRALGRQQSLPQEAVATWIKAVEDEDSTLRSAAIYALRKQQSLPQEALATLIKALEDEDSYVRSAAMYALGKQPSLPQEAVATLIKAFEDENSNVRSAAVGALGKQPSLPQEAVATLIKALEDENSNVRSAAIRALRKQQSLPQEALATLIKALEDEDSRVRSAAIRALEKQPSLPQETVATLIKAVEDEDSYVRSAAIYALGEQQSLSQEAIATLMAILKNEDKEDYARISAANILEQQSFPPEDILADLITTLNREAALDYPLHLYYVLNRCNFFSRIIDLNSQAWRKLWSYWLKEGRQRYDLCCYKLESSLYLWSSGTLHIISTNATQTREFLDAVLDPKYEKVRPIRQLKEQPSHGNDPSAHLTIDESSKHNKLEKKGRGLRNFLRKIVK